MSEKAKRLSLFDQVSLVIATWFGSGLLPKMPGTWGTLAAVPLVAVLAVYLTWPWYIAAVVVLTLIGIPAATRTAYLSRSNERIGKLNPHSKPVFSHEKLQGMLKDSEGQKEDPGMIVIDEVIGYAVSVLFLEPSIVAFTGAFILFRIFDIIKPFPVRLLERIGSGTGIVLDDVAAGVYACLLSHLGMYIYVQLLGLPVF